MPIAPNASRAFSASARQRRSVEGGILEHEHLLQKDRRVQPRGQNEMAGHEGADSVKLVKRLIRG